MISFIKKYFAVPRVQMPYIMISTHYTNFQIQPVPCDCIINGSTKFRVSSLAVANLQRKGFLYYGICTCGSFCSISYILLVAHRRHACASIGGGLILIINIHAVISKFPSSLQHFYKCIYYFNQFSCRKWFSAK